MEYTHFVHSRNLRAIDPRIPTMPGAGTEQGAHQDIEETGVIRGVYKGRGKKWVQGLGGGGGSYQYFERRSEGQWR